MSACTARDKSHWNGIYVPQLARPTYYLQFSDNFLKRFLYKFVMTIGGVSKKEDVFVRQQYGRVGQHSVVKICGWTKKHLRCGDNCYKHHFYGISTGQCLEMSPVLICNQRCKHCWRDQSLFNEVEEWDEPKEIIKGCIEERRKLLMGFKGSEKTDLKEFKKCLVPKQAAISLTGEPCLYPYLPELVSEFYLRGFESVFVVTNGTVPNMLRKLGRLSQGPTNVYLSIEWWDEESYTKFCKPLEKGQYARILESMEVLKELSSAGKVKTVLRITSVVGWNMDKAQEMKWIVERMRPDFIEVKGYMHVGYSKLRMERRMMPLHPEVVEFAAELTKVIDYKVSGEQKESRVVLLENESSSDSQQS